MHTPTKKLGSLRLESLSWLFRPRESLQRGVIAEQIRREWEARGGGTDPKFSDREFRRVLLGTLDILYKGDSQKVDDILHEAVQFVIKVREAVGHDTVHSNLSGRIVSWDEVRKFAAEQPDKKWVGGGNEIALRYIALCQTIDGFSGN